MLTPNTNFTVVDWELGQMACFECLNLRTSASALCPQCIPSNLCLSMSSLVHALISIMPCMPLYVSEVPLDILDPFEILGGLYNLSQVAMLGLPASGQQANCQLAVRLNRRFALPGHISTAIKMAVSSMALLVVQGDFPERNSSLSKTAHPPGPGLLEHAPSDVPNT